MPSPEKSIAGLFQRNAGWNKSKNYVYSYILILYKTIDDLVTVSSCWGCYMNIPIKNGKGPPGGADRLADWRSFPVPGTTCPGWKKWYVFYWFCCFICYLREVYREFWHHWCQIIHFLLQWSFFWISGGFIHVINNVLSCLRESTRGRGFIANFLLVMHFFTNLNILDDGRVRSD